MPPVHTTIHILLVEDLIKDLLGSIQNLLNVKSRHLISHCTIIHVSCLVLLLWFLFRPVSITALISWPTQATVIQRNDCPSIYAMSMAFPWRFGTLQIDNHHHHD